MEESVCVRTCTKHGVVARLVRVGKTGAFWPAKSSSWVFAAVYLRLKVILLIIVTVILTIAVLVDIVQMNLPSHPQKFQLSAGILEPIGCPVYHYG